MAKKYILMGWAYFHDKKNKEVYIPKEQIIEMCNSINERNDIIGLTYYLEESKK